MGQLFVKLQGYEKCWWQETRHRTVGEGPEARTETYTVDFDGSRDVFKTKIDLIHQGEPLAPGNYDIPFMFVLPADGIPGSIVYKSSDMKAKVGPVQLRAC